MRMKRERKAGTRGRLLDPTRATMTLLAVAAAGLLAWLTTTLDDGTTGGYWAEYGILAGAGLALALSQLAGGWTKWGRPRLSLPVFLTAFLPTLVAVGWITAFHQPHRNWFRGHALSWSADLGIAGLVDSLGGDLLAMFALGLGLVFGLSFDTTRTAAAAPPAPAEADTPVAAPLDERVADEPLTRDREVVHSAG